MAMSNAVWGIDIGQCALKALRCKFDDDEKTIIADAYDYIEYPKILSQPEANREELIRDALEQFLSRNNTLGDKVAMSVPGQAGLSRFFKPPPVDAKMLPDIVKYEARQQIPFPLEDVVWDFQKIGGMEVDGFTLDAEVGLFAMKRDQVFRAIKPFSDAGIELYHVQLAPIAVYNYVSYDLLDGGPDMDEVDPDDPPESLVILSIGTETTDLVITNGVRIWQRSIPLGGNHFTKQLSRELKMTYVKAEHLKRNAREAEDAKTVFQVMRPVFNDFVTEIQRSLNFFQNIDKQTKVGRLVMLGNTVKLPGLRQYLSKNLSLDVIKIDEFRYLKGGEVKSSPQFKENLLSYSVAYGLCLQGLGAANLGTNLLPQEFTDQRLIREKKPWAIAAVGALLLAFSFNFVFHYGSAHKVDAEDYAVEGTNWDTVFNEFQGVKSVSQNHKQEHQKQETLLEHYKGMGEEVVGAGDRKVLWLELFRAINEALPVDPRFADNPAAIRDPLLVPYEDRPDIYIDYVESEYYEELKDWWNPANQQLWSEIKQHDAQKHAADGPFATTTGPAAAPAVDPDDPNAAADPAATPAGPEAPAEDGAMVEGDEETGPEGPGWIIEIGAHHFHNSASTIENGSGYNFVRNTFIQNLMDGSVELPIEPPVGDTPPATSLFTMEELGIGYPVIVRTSDIMHNFQIPNPRYESPNNGNQAGAGGLGGIPEAGGATARPKPTAEDEAKNPQYFKAPKYDFVIQFVWREKRLRARLETRAEAERAKVEAERQAANDPNAVTPTPLPAETPPATPPAATPPAATPPAETPPATPPAATPPAATPPAATPPVAPAEPVPAAPAPAAPAAEGGN